MFLLSRCNCVGMEVTLDGRLILSSVVVNFMWGISALKSINDWLLFINTSSEAVVNLVLSLYCALCLIKLKFVLFNFSLKPLNNLLAHAINLLKASKLLFADSYYLIHFFKSLFILIIISLLHMVSGLSLILAFLSILSP